MAMETQNLDAPLRTFVTEISRSANLDWKNDALAITLQERPRPYLWVIVNTPSQFVGGSSNKYSWQRFQYARAGPSSGHRSMID
jgi:hypothetical protein